MPKRRREDEAASKGTTQLKIGLCGCGTVGTGLLEIIQDRSAFFATLGVELQIAKICVRNKEKKRSFIPEGCVVTTSYDDIINDDSIDCVVEVMGGTTDAKAVVFGAIENGKHVVTANKALLAEFLPELQALLNKHPVLFGLEAAVCGGIPIINTLQHSLLGDGITKITGIMNGTTNFMLSKMESEGLPYAVVLKEAQELGFAEADPSADVDGFDVRAKIALLAKLGLGCYVDVSLVKTVGISNITKFDFQYAKHLKCTIKLLGMAEMNADEELSIMVSPMLVPEQSPLGAIRGATNAVSVASKNLSTSFLVGPGAGALPTANSVIADVLGVARGNLEKLPFPKDKPTKMAADFSGCFYVRFMVKDGLGILHAISEAFLKHKVSIDQVVQIPPEPQGWDRDRCPFVLLTDCALYSQVKEACESLAKHSWNASKPFYMPVCDI
jgi:homoserine dehydrogenase